MSSATTTESLSLAFVLQKAMQESRQGNLFLMSDVLHNLKSCFNSKDEARLLSWVNAFVQNLQGFTYETRPFFDTLSSLPWLSSEDPIARPFLNFLESLVSAEPQFASTVINTLISCLKSPEPHVLTTLPPNVYFDRIHATLSSILTTIPLGPTLAVSILEQHFPHRRLSLAAHQTYIQNILKILDYAPLLKEAILSLILEKLVLIDVEIQTDLEDIDPNQRNLQFYIEINGAPPPGMSATDDIMCFRDLHVSSQSDSAIGSLDESDNEVETMTGPSQDLSVEALGIKLDYALDMLFAYISKQGTESPALLQETFLVALKLFEKLMLPMFKSRYCQYFLFKLCAFEPAFIDHFLGALTKTLLDLSEPPLLRINAALYMASFLARANFVSFQEHVKPCFQLLLLFVHAFVANNEQYVKHPSVEKFGVFYAATQAVLYLFCFHWKNLCHEETGLGEKGGLEGFERILLSKFNPLLVLKPTLVEEFARITHCLNLVHCHAIVQRNQRIFLPSAHSATTPQMLDTFFPFEPVALPRATEWIDPLYTTYERPVFAETSAAANVHNVATALPQGTEPLPAAPRPSSSIAMDISTAPRPGSSATMHIPAASVASSLEDRASCCAVLDYLSTSPSSAGAHLLLAQLGITSQ